MRLTRRDVHKGLLGLLLAGGAGSLGRATGAEAPDIYLNRLTFGANPQARADFQKRGLHGWLDAELSKPVSDLQLDQILAQARLNISYAAGENEAGATWPATDEDRPLDLLNADPASLLPLLDFAQNYDFSERIRPADEVLVASLIRAVNADAQLREMMTAFWHDHFNVNAFKDVATAVFFPQYDTVLRINAFGNFRTMLGYVARSPAMLAYLNNDVSRASPANENYARELLELHTLGRENYLNDLYDNWRAVPGAQVGRPTGYIDQDVYEVARAFTGWTIGDGRWVDDTTDAPNTGRFHYIESWHDPYQKRVLGVEFLPHQGPMADGDKVLDILATHPGTGRFIARKLLQRFGIENPSDRYLDAVATAFSQNSDAADQIAQVLQVLILDVEFAATPPTKMRRPFEFLVALYRAAGARVVSPTRDFDWHLTRAGWTQHAVRPPTGHSDQTLDWANTRTLNGLVGLALNAHEDWMGVQSGESALMNEAQTIGDLGHVTDVRFGLVAGTTSTGFAALGIGLNDQMPKDLGERKWLVSISQACAALTPAFLLR